MGRQDEKSLEDRSGDPEEEEEELVDPIHAVRKKCEAKAECQKFREKLDACETRVNSRSHTEEQCKEELFDFLIARDHCVAKHLFSKLK